MAHEGWIDIPGYEESYKINNSGDVLGLKKGKVLNLYDNKGYKTVYLYKNKVRKYYLVHRLVYTVFIGDIPKGYEIDHIDNNRANNSLDNLQLLSPRYNSIKRSSRMAGRSSSLAGVTFENNKWRSRIRVGDRHVHLGMYSTEEAAGAAYINALNTY